MHSSYLRAGRSLHHLGQVSTTVHWWIQGAPPVCAPQQDPILSFLYTFLPNSAHIGGWHPQRLGAPPPQREILDPPLVSTNLCELQQFYFVKSLPVEKFFIYTLFHFCALHCPDSFIYLLIIFSLFSFFINLQFLGI